MAAATTAPSWPELLSLSWVEVGKTIVLGLGNLLLGDEGVRVHVVRRLQELKPDLPGVEVIDGGTAGFELLPFFKEAERVIVVDAARGGPSGSVYRLRLEDLSNEGTSISLHQLSFREVLRAAELLEIKPEVVIIGIEPERIAPGLELSPAVEAALPRAVALVLEELQTQT